jgi:hypothetical protein
MPFVSAHSDFSTLTRTSSTWSSLQMLLLRLNLLSTASKTMPQRLILLFGMGTTRMHTPLWWV